MDFRKILASTGAALVGYTSYKILKFIYIHFIRSSSLHRYQGGQRGRSWALITGSSDGIGRGFAEELCQRGFNVVIHGRNRTKLEGVKADLEKQWPEASIRIAVIDASAATDKDLQSLAASLSDIRLTILVNNVAGGATNPLWCAFDTRTQPEIDAFLDTTARFPTLITHALFPLLLRHRVPSLVVNIGSGAGCFPIPYLGVYAAAKAYNLEWSSCLRAEMHAEGHDVDVLGVLVGMVQSNTARRPTSFLVPSSRRMASVTLDVVGCGESVLYPYWPHAVQFGLLGLLPGWLMEKAFIGIAKGAREEEMRELKGL